MKKILIPVLLIIFAMTIMTSVCYASNNENEIVNLAKQNEKVKEANCVIYENNCILALKTEKFLSRSEYDAFKIALEKTICEKYNFQHVVVTANPRAMQAINKISELSDSEREEALKKFVEFQLQPKPHRPHVQPK